MRCRPVAVPVRPRRETAQLDLHAVSSSGRCHGGNERERGHELGFGRTGIVNGNGNGSGHTHLQTSRFSHRTNSSSSPGLTFSGTTTPGRLSQPTPTTPVQIPAPRGNENRHPRRLSTDVDPSVAAAADVTVGRSRNKANANTATATIPHTGPLLDKRLESWRHDVARDAYPRLPTTPAPSAPIRPSTAPPRRERTPSVDTSRRQQPAPVKTAPVRAPRMQPSWTIPPMDFRPPIRVTNPPRIVNTFPKRRPTNPPNVERPRSSTPIPSARVEARHHPSQSQTYTRQRSSSTPRPTHISSSTLLTRPIESATKLRDRTAKPLPPLPPPSPIQQPCPPKFKYREYEYGPSEELNSVYSDTGSAYKVNGYGVRVDPDLYNRRWNHPNEDVVDISTERARSPSEY